MDTEQEVESFLWSICQGYDGDGWTKWDNKEVDRQIQKIRFTLKTHFDSDLYARHCNAECRGRDNFGKNYKQQVSIDSKRCHIHGTATFK